MRILLASLLIASAAACATTPTNPGLGADMPQPQPASEEHAWLLQFVGEWDVVGEADMGPGTEPMRMQFRETVRPIGSYWIVGESRADFDGTPFHSVLTLGYDSNRQHFVGSWVDSFQTHFWTYRGSLDAGKRVLTLEAQGPAFGDPTQLANYRDVIEWVGPNLRRSSSWIQQGSEWVKFMSSDATRRR